MGKYMCQGDLIGGMYISRYNGPPKSKENIQNILLNVMFIQTMQGQGDNM